jgi:hypothetical protein
MTSRDQKMACLGWLICPWTSSTPSNKNSNNKSKILVRTTSSSSSELFASIAGKYIKEHNQHIVPTKQHSTINNQ